MEKAIAAIHDIYLGKCPENSLIKERIHSPFILRINRIESK